MTTIGRPIPRIPNTTTWPSGDLGPRAAPAVRLSLALLLAFALGLLTTGRLHAEDPTVLTGQVLIGPTCPVARPNQPGCGDRPYQATISVQTADGSQELARVDTDTEGVFSIELAADDYLLVPLTPQGSILPRGEPQLVSVAPDTTTTIVLRFDSGLR